jgi:hypothetical protein
VAIARGVCTAARIGVIHAHAGDPAQATAAADKAAAVIPAPRTRGFSLICVSDAALHHNLQKLCVVGLRQRRVDLVEHRRNARRLADLIA